MITIENFKDVSSPALDKFLNHQDGVTIFHKPEWHRVIESSYGHKADYWVAKADGEIVSAFPVVSVKFPLLGTKMIAMPYQFHSGLPLGNDPVVQKHLIENAIGRVHQYDVKYLEIRYGAPIPFLEEMGFVNVDSQLVTTTTCLTGLELKHIFRGHREFVKYPFKRGVTIKETKTLSDLMAFRKMYLNEGRSLGSPQASWKFFQNIHKYVHSNFRLYLASRSNTCLGGLLILESPNNRVFARCSAYGSEEARSLHVGKALFWRAISDSIERGFTAFDWGISWSGDKGLIKFKEGWNGTSDTVYTYVYSMGSKPPVPGEYFDGFNFAKSVWKKLPLPIVDWVGGQITRWIC